MILTMTQASTLVTHAHIVVKDLAMVVMTALTLTQAWSKGLGHVRCDGL